jgi:hypothetical protein
MRSSKRRNYLKERCDYYGSGKVTEITPGQRLRRKHKAARNRARARVKRVLHARWGIPGHAIAHLDVDHVDGNPLNNSFENLRLLSIKKNRGRKKRKYFFN